MSAITDPVADLLTRLRNAASASKRDIELPYSRLKADIARVLKREGYIEDFELDSTQRHPQLKIRCKYVNRVPAIAGLKRVSRPGIRRYVGSQEIPRVLRGMGIAILSTSSGVMSGREARRRNVGGELLAYVW